MPTITTENIGKQIIMPQKRRLRSRFTALGDGSFVNGMAAQRCKAPLIKTDNSNKLQATIRGVLAISVTKSLTITQLVIISADL